jgi:hypothetical protein
VLWSNFGQDSGYPAGSEIFTTAEVDKIFSGYQPYQLVKITDASGTVSVPSSGFGTADNPRRFYQRLSSLRIFVVFHSSSR